MSSAVCFVNVQSSFPENVVFSVCACMDNATAAYIIFIMWNSVAVICRSVESVQLGKTLDFEKDHGPSFLP